MPEGAFKVIPLEKQVQMLKELSAHKGWNPGWDLKKLQQRVQKTLNNWTDFYRTAMGNCEHSPSPKPLFASSNCIDCMKVRESGASFEEVTKKKQQISLIASSCKLNIIE